MKKICKDCKWYSYYKTCSHPNFVMSDLIEGELHQPLCLDVRSMNFNIFKFFLNKYCGKEGVLWEPKEKSDK